MSGLASAAAPSASGQASEPAGMGGGQGLMPCPFQPTGAHTVRHFLRCTPCMGLLVFHP